MEPAWFVNWFRNQRAKFILYTNNSKYARFYKLCMVKMLPKSITVKRQQVGYSREWGQKKRDL